MPHGILILNKPPSMSSRQAVDHVQRLARPAKVGHAGTLDPLASGVLVTCVGAATRLIEYVQQMRKSYSGTFLLGRQSPTEDTEGRITELDNPPIPSRERIDDAARAFVGRIQQRPPVFSALKVGGRRAYELARKGREVELKPRPVTIYSIGVTRYDYPELELAIECGGGTYVRSLGRDLAESLGTAAVMSALVRTAIGRFLIEDAVDPRELLCENWIAAIRPMAEAAVDLPTIEVGTGEIERVRNGLMIARSALPSEVKEFAAIDAQGRLIAILRPRGDGFLGSLRNLMADED